MIIIVCIDILMSILLPCQFCYLVNSVTNISVNSVTHCQFYYPVEFHYFSIYIQFVDFFTDFSVT